MNDEKPRIKWLAGEFYQIFRNKLTPVFLNLFQKLEEDR